MGSTNFTTHYSIPLPLGTDLTTPMDYNEAAEAVDTALFGAVTDAGNASDAAAAAVSTANAASEAVDTVSADLVQEKAKIVALQTRMTNAENEIDDVRADGQDAICAYNEPTATSTHAYAIGDYFFYNNTLYQATAAIAIGATITPNTNCETTNITSELIQINSDISDINRALSDKVDSSDLQYLSTGWTELSNNPFYDSSENPNSVLRVRRWGNVVSVHFNLISDEAITKETLIGICTIQNSSFFPKYRVIAEIGMYAAVTKEATAKVYINTDGTINFISDDDVLQSQDLYLQGEVVYIIDEI